MSDLTEALDDLNHAQQDSFGEPCIYQPPGGMPVAFTGMRVRRAQEAIVEAGSFEGLSIRESEFPSLPVIGGIVLINRVSYVITDMHDPYAYDGLRVLILNRRKPNA